MTRSAYYREQARVLLSMAMASTDEDIAARLQGRAAVYLAMADDPPDRPNYAALFDVFKDRQVTDD